MAAAAADAVAPTLAAKPVVFAGITLEYVGIDRVTKELGLTQAEIETIMAVGPNWPHPGFLDGWKMSHDAIRLDMENFLKAIEKTKEQVDAGKPLAAWQVRHFQTIAKNFYHEVHSHHDHEEAIFFPYMETRVKLPPKMSLDHKALMAALDRVRDLCAALQPDMKGEPAKKVVDELLEVFTSMRGMMRQHLEEEEIIGLPILRKNFTAKEIAVTEKKIIATMKPADLAWFLRPLSLEDKRATMTRFEIPGLAQKLVLLPAVNKDDKTVMRAYRELAAGEQTQPPKSKGLFSCFAC